MFLRPAIFIAVFIVISFLPIIPMLREPVVPPPFRQSTFHFASLQDVFGVFAFQRVGVVYKLQWYSFVAIFGLLAVGYLVGKFLTKAIAFKIRGRRQEA
jgi:hypothetical protein